MGFEPRRRGRRRRDHPPQRLWVHCASGYRSGIAASLLQRAGKDVVHIDAMFNEAESVGLPMAES